MARRNSNQRITKIKKDYIEELLKRAEAMDVEDACSIQPPGSDLVPYPDLNNLRLWTRDYLLSGMNKIFPVKFDENGQTYYTCLIDGLPLHTKLTKQTSATSAQLASFLNVIGSPTISSDGFASNLDSNNYFTITDDNIIANEDSTVYVVAKIPANISNATIFKAQFPDATLELKAISSSSYSWYYNNSVVTTSSLTNLDISKNITFSFKYVLTSPESTVQDCRIAYYKTGSDYISTTTTYLRISPTGNCQSFIIGGNSTPVSGLVYDFNQSWYYDGSNHYFVTTVPGVETSKPGLWLSNLVAPVSNSIAGSWLRHNLVHDSESDFNTFNSDTIGNYSYSFFQRGVLHRTNGSTHDDNDSYCQHWSPSALSCISHEAIVIPGNLLQKTYTSYQTLVTPSDPDMQSYYETMSKDVTYNFIDNNDNIPLNTTQYNGRVVGDGWIYELEFIPNGNGSGNDYGDGDDPSSNNGSNGGCIVGTIVYQDSSLGTTCTQEVNSCYQTTQSYFNPLVPNVPGNNQINDDQITTHVVNSCAGICCNMMCGTGGNRSGYYWVKNTRYQGGTENLKVTGFKGRTQDGTTIEFPVNGASSAPIQWNYYSGSATCGCEILQPIVQPGFSGFCTTCGSYQGLDFLLTEELPEEEGVTLYLNIYDLKKQYESQGLPFPGGCGTDRFSIEISTTQCGQPGGFCTSFVIAENVDINSLGDISKLENLVWSNSVN